MRQSWKMLAPRPVMNRPRISAGTALGSAKLAERLCRHLVEEEVLIVGRGVSTLISASTARLSPILTSDFIDSSLTMFARVLIGSGLSSALMSGVDRRLDRAISPSALAAIAAASNDSSE